MKIFNRGAETAKPAPVAVSAAPVQAPPPTAPVAPPSPDLTSIIDANVKEMSEKIARLATTIEGEHSERADFEAKLEKMEERMRKLSSLTEMISAQYNPFVGAAPSEREALPQPEVGLAMPPVSMPPAALPPPASASPLQISIDEPPAASLALGELPPFPDADALRIDFQHAAAPQDPPPTMTPEPALASLALESENNDGQAARIWSLPHGFASSLIVLNWADMLLKNAPNREALADMLNYYHNIGWIGDPARDQLLAYADGLTWSGPAEAREWRANVMMHEMSLLYIEKLRALSNERRGA